jgi:hypothetical protein
MPSLRGANSPLSYARVGRLRRFSIRPSGRLIVRNPRPIKPLGLYGHCSAVVPMICGHSTAAPTHGQPAQPATPPAPRRRCVKSRCTTTIWLRSIGRPGTQGPVGPQGACRVAANSEPDRPGVRMCGQGRGPRTLLIGSEPHGRRGRQAVQGLPGARAPQAPPADQRNQCPSHPSLTAIPFL